MAGFTIPFGMIGLLAILAGWIYETSVALRTKRSPMPAPFALLYGFGSLMLSIYSWTLDDVVFVVLNVAATLIALINLWLALSAAKPPATKRGERAAASGD
jgi:lipid-A-disaccharide synthase-like uncharacterized protein